MAHVPDDMTDLDRPLTVREFREFRTEVFERFATKEDLKTFRTEVFERFATKEDLKTTRDELRRYIDVMIESFKTEFANLYDWTRSTTDGLAGQVAKLSTRTASLETRVTRLDSAGGGSRRKK